MTFLPFNLLHRRLLLPLVFFFSPQGGLLVAATINLRPELCRAVLMKVPFVDVVTSMCDEDMPWVKFEYEEWGNPTADPLVYAYQKSYCPYTNICQVR